MPATPIVGIAGKDRALLSARASTAPEPASFGPFAEVPQRTAAARRRRRLRCGPLDACLARQVAVGASILGWPDVHDPCEFCTARRVPA